MPMKLDADSVRDGRAQGVDAARWYCNAGHDVWVRPAVAEVTGAGRFAAMNPYRRRGRRRVVRCEICGGPIEASRTLNARRCLKCPAARRRRTA